MSRVKNRLTYANVASTIALVVALTMGSAWASGQLAKNSVGTKQLKDDAVNGAKVADGSLSGADIGGSVGSADHASKADSAANADHASSADSASHADSADSATNASHADSATSANHAGSADSATNASHADTADSATSATNAGHAANSDELGGSPPSAYFSSARVQRIEFSPSVCTAVCPANLATVAGFTLTGSCTGNSAGSSSEASVTVSDAPAGGTANFSYVHNGNTALQGGFGGTGTTFDLTNNGSQSQGAVGTIILHAPGSTVSVELHVLLSSNYFGAPINVTSANCQFFGTVLQA